jgi:DNA-binding beta-propeller fold protein YncE
VVDRASRVIAKFDPAGRVVMTLGRRPEAIGEVGSSAGGGGGRGGGGGGAAPGAAPGAAAPGAAAPGAAAPGAAAPGAATPGAAAPGAGRGGGGGGGRGGRGGAPGAGAPGDNFNQPLDVAWDTAGNIFVVDGYSNARVAKFDKTGRFAKSWGSTGAEPGQFSIPHSIAVDAQGNVYVADMGNKRIQVFDNDGTFKTQFTNVGAPRAICISPGPQQFLFASNSNPTEDPFLNGEIYKLQLDGTIVGRFGKAGKQFKEFGMVNAIDCRDPNTLFVAELMNWRVQKLTLK